MKKIITISLSIALLFIACNPKASNSIAKTNQSKNTMEKSTPFSIMPAAVKDPFNVVEHTFENGLKLYMAINDNEPRVQTMIAVKTGSKNDPPEVTGLAHYLEHMLFKGTSKLGALNWEKEKVILKKISDQYELYRFEKDETKRKEIYKIIDQLSQEAAKFVATNEYDNLIHSLGAKGTNAFTSNERTVYVNDIPSNELDRWMSIESERFSELVLRLFHTELEAVFEEFNRGQDNDWQAAHQTLMKNLFKKHTYGTQSTIGLGEHLKRPSMVKIHEYFDKYYVPNNMAIIIAGDIDPKVTIAMVEKHFGHFKSKPVTQFSCDKEDPIMTPIIKDVQGTDAEFINIAFRIDGGTNSKDRMYLELMDMVMNNGEAGLIDLNLTKKQLVLRAGSYPVNLNDYSMYTMIGNPREGQTLEDVKDLLLGQLELIKKGEFDDWLLPAVIKQLKLNQIRTSESNRGIAYQILDAFIADLDWKKETQYLNEMSKITKSQLIAWVNKNFKNNYVVINKRKGDKKSMKVEKPTITQIPINRNTPSNFAKRIKGMTAMRMKASFVDYKTEIKKSILDNNLPFSYVDNKNNERFRMSYILDMGIFNDKKMGLAVGYLEYLGTDKYSSEDIQKEMFKLGISYNVYAADEKIYVTLSGLQESFDRGVILFEHLLNNAIVDQDAYNKYVQGILKKRKDVKLSKYRILHRGLNNYGKYGTKNPIKNIIPNDELANINPQLLVDKIKSITSYKHQVYYYGPAAQSQITGVLNREHNTPKVLKDYPKPLSFPELETKSNKVLFTNYDMVQTELMMISKGTPLNKDVMAIAKVFNEYFGSGLSSIVFQEIRESKALAYSAYSYYSTPDRPDNAHYVNAYIGTQTDKLPKAIDALLELMSDMPAVKSKFEEAKKAALIKMETSKTKRSRIFWNAERSKKMGFENNNNQLLYSQIKNLSLDDLVSFFNNNIANKKYTFLVLGKKGDVDMNALKKLGPIEEISLEELFGY